MKGRQELEDEVMDHLHGRGLTRNELRAATGMYREKLLNVLAGLVERGLVTRRDGPLYELAKTKKPA